MHVHAHKLSAKTSLEAEYWYYVRTCGEITVYNCA
jgi:hypothetical protein